jgi:hypothetical protein
MKYNGSSRKTVGSPGFSDGEVWDYFGLYVDNSTPYVAYTDRAN